ncbi:MAG: hypothetical protein DI637_06925 [Citromicrobium sp.]|nr:MAG: hypothetical protein DI637_06925 [Citromicrobium sp.]
MSALEAHHGIGPACQPVDDLALALIAPLGADYGNVGQGTVDWGAMAARDARRGLEARRSTVKADRGNIAILSH